MQELFKPRESRYELRGFGIFKKSNISRTNTKERCLSAIGVNLWNKLDNELKTSNSIFQFKRKYKSMTIEKYIDSL